MPGPELYIAFGIYLLVIFYFGWLGWQRTRSHNDFILGGRQLGPVTTALSAGASDMSGWLLLGLPGLAFDIGLGASWLAAGLLVGTFLNWHWVAPKLRKASERLQSLTIPAYLHNRFQDKQGSLMLTSSLFILIFSLLYTSSGLVAGGKLFEAVFDIPYQYAVITGGLVIVAYTFLGGFLAVSWTDVVQALLMLSALLVVPVLAYQVIQSQPELANHVSQRSDLFYFSYDQNGQPFTWLQIISLCAWGLGYFGQPHILARFKAIQDPKQLKRAKQFGVGWTFLTLTGAIATGICGALYFTSPLEDSEKVFIQLVNVLFNPWIAGILLAAILAAIMSTADSQLLVCSAAFSDNIYKHFHATTHNSVLVSRITVIVIAALAMIIALQPDSGVLDLVAYAWAGFGAAFGPTLLFSLYWKGTTRLGALAGIIIGAVTVFVWRNLSGGILDLYEIVPGVLFSAIAIVLVSYLSKPATDPAVTS